MKRNDEQIIDLTSWDDRYEFWYIAKKLLSDAWFSTSSSEESSNRFYDQLQRGMKNSFSAFYCANSYELNCGSWKCCLQLANQSGGQSLQEMMLAPLLLTTCFILPPTKHQELFLCSMECFLNISINPPRIFIQNYINNINYYTLLLRRCSCNRGNCLGWKEECK